VTRVLPTRLFALIALTIVIVCTVIVRTSSHADIAAWGVTFDLTLTIPLVWYFVVVRSGTARPMTLAPVFVVCMMLAALVVPRGQQQFLHDLRYLSAPLEIVTLIFLGRRLAKVRDVESATRAMFGHSRAADFVASEVSILWYAVFCWRTKPPEEGFTVHQRNGWGTIAACIVAMIGFESIGMHLLVQQWSVKAAWIVTALDLYGVLWIVGDYHALRLRPTYSAEGILHLRYGLRWNAEIPLAEIESIDDVRGEADWKRKNVLKMAMLDEPKYLVKLRRPVTVNGLAGIRRTIDAIAVLPDDIEAFDRTLRR
jgi:hypothetical protein